MPPERSDPNIDPSVGSDAPAASAATSLSLLERARDSDPAAWQRIVHLYSPIVYDWCRRYRLQNEDAADLLQEVFRSVATGLARFRHDRSGDTFRGWLWTVTRNKLRDHFRARDGRPVATGGSEAQAQLQTIPDQEPSDASSGAAEPGNLLGRALDLIRGDYEERTWQAFWRVTVDGQSPADVAADLGVTVFAVYQAKYRITQRLRDDLRGLVE